MYVGRGHFFAKNMREMSVLFVSFQHQIGQMLGVSGIETNRPYQRTSAVGGTVGDGVCATGRYTTHRL
jgi:hypothetical protein